MMATHWNRCGARWVACLLATVALVWGTVSAAPLAVVNHDFEAGTTGWTTVGGSSAFAPTWTDGAGGHYYASGQPAGVGGSVAWANNPGGSLYQQIGTLQADTVYELSVGVGQRKDIAVSNWEMWLRLDSPGWGHASPPAIDLAKIDHTSGNPASGYFVDKIVTADSADFPANYAGKSLYVTLYAGGTGGVQTNFDNVRVMATPGPGAPIVIDEEGATLGGTGWGGPGPVGYNSDITYSNHANATATWTFGGLADGQYDVLASWTLHPNRSTDVSYTIASAPAVHVNQETHGTGVYLQGSPVSNTFLLNYLGGPVAVSGGSLSVTASNNRSGPNDFMMIDAVAIRPAAPRTTIMDNNSAGYTTDFTGGNDTQGFLSGVDYTAPNASSADMESSWSFTDLPDGMYKVYATWNTHANRTQAAPYSVWDGSGQLGSTIPVNQEASPFRFAGRDLQNIDTANWRSLGSYRVGDGTLAVRLNGVDNTSGTDYVIADAVRLEPIAPTPHVPWIGVFRAGGPGTGDPWYFTQHLTRPHVSDATNPAWGEGSLGDQPVAGDWDGDGVDGIAVFRSQGGNAWYFANDRSQPITSFSTGPWGAGSLGDIAVAGDWDGDGTDGIGVFRTSVGGTGTNWFLKNDPMAPTSDYRFHYGDGTAVHGDLPVAGDWDGDGLDDIGLFRPSTGEWFFDTNFDGIADLYNPGFGTGALGDIPVAGHFVPEPATLALLALGLLPILRRRRR